MKLQIAFTKLGHWNVHALQSARIYDINSTATIHKNISDPEVPIPCFHQRINNQSMPSWVRDVRRVIRLVESDWDVSPLHITQNCRSCRVDFSEPYLFYPLLLPSCEDD